MKKMILFICFLLLAASPALAKKNKSNKEKKYQVESHQAYHGKGLPPGLQKKVDGGKKLPPGWQKKIAKGKTIDDSIFPHLEVVPREVLKILPPLPPGVSFKKIEGKIVKIHNINRQILEVLELDKLPLPPLP